MSDKPLPWFLNFRVFPNPFTLLDFPAYSYLMLQASDKMCTQHFCFLKNILLKKTQAPIRIKLVLIVSQFQRNIQIQKGVSTVYTIFVEKTTKSFLAISPRFPIVYKLEAYLTPYPDLLCTSKESYSKVHVLKNNINNFL